MIFNSLEYMFFLPIVFIIYWLLNNGKLQYQNLFLLAVSYFFYSCWDWRFLFLLIFSTALDYFTGIKMHESKTEKIKKFWFWTSIIINLGFLGVFKYYNFFAESFAQALSNIGFQANFWTIQVILPIGISFYTFHGLSYVIDIYKGRIVPEKNIVSYSLFVSYFPLLVAGPIERATHLLPQIKKKRVFNYTQAVDGLRQILWGLFKKMVIADNCAEYANLMFNNADQHNGSSLILGAVFFAFQIYGDFSGYSDIALGTSKLLGIDLLKNFNYPYFSRDIAEFWRRWHISLSSWFKDYLYIPLGGSNGSMWMKVRNTFIIFIVSGFWHGANWTFIAWGLLNALFIMPSIIFKTNRNNIEIVAKNKFFPSLKEAFQIITTFGLATFAWIFFRSDNLQKAFAYISKIFSSSSLHLPSRKPNVEIMALLIVFIFIEWLGKENDFGLQKIAFKQPQFLRWILYIVLVIIVLLFAGKEQVFIYFQF
jgi:D-alanyl-lipoteichoic acid acyltransferase DltB (MBOAT superfamily)